MECEVTTVIDQPIAVVWDFYAVHHVENHPRWDPDIELQAATDGPIGVGTVIRRRSTRFETPTEGTMEITEFDPERTMRVRTQDGPMTINGWARFSSPSSDRTELTIGGDFPGLDDSMKTTIVPLMERSARNIKSLIEAER
jgi:hypothetical protein